MDKRKINKKEMFDVVVSYLNGKLAAWSSIPKVGEFLNQFTTVVAQIETAQYAQQQARVFLGKSKTQIKSMVAEKADILNDTVETYALVNGNEELRLQMSASYSGLNRLRNADFIPAIKAVIDAVQENIDVLTTEYGTTSEQVESLKADFDEFLTLNGQPRAYKVASVEATKNLELLFDEADAILNERLDKVINIFKRRDPGFYNGYLAARVIVDS